LRSEVARQLKVPRMMLIVNKVPSVFDSAAVKTQVEQTYNCPVATVLPHSDEMMALASAGIFALLFCSSPHAVLQKQSHPDFPSGP